jgi:Mn2+/Fe2+ NRAMP family transporter
VAGSLFALAKMVVEALHVVRPGRGERYPDGRTSDPAYRWVIVWGLLAVVWSLPHAPGFVALVVVSHVLTSPFLLLIVIALIAMLNRTDIMGRFTNSWKENVGLGLVAAFVAVAAVQGIGKAVGELFS